MRILWLVLGLSACAAMPEAPLSRFLPLDAPTHHVLAADLDGDGDKDLLFTSHGGNFAQVYFQEAPRRFASGPRIKEVGFHPWGWVPLGKGLYLVNGEGAGKLMVFRASKGGIEKVAERRARQPRHATLFHWPTWGLGLAVVPYGGRSIDLVKGFDPQSAAAEGVVEVKAGRGRIGPVAVMDLDGDGTEELLFADQKGNALRFIAYPGKERPKAKLLWQFERGWPLVVVPFEGELFVTLPVAGRIARFALEGGRLKALPFPDFPLYGPLYLAAAKDRDGTRYLAAGGNPGVVLYRWGEAFEEQVLHPDIAPYHMVFEDMDGDGWLDLVAAGEGMKKKAPWILYGPLWENAKALSVP